MDWRGLARLNIPERSRKFREGVGFQLFPGQEQGRHGWSDLWSRFPFQVEVNSVKTSSTFTPLIYVIRHQ